MSTDLTETFTYLTPTKLRDRSGTVHPTTPERFTVSAPKGSRFTYPDGVGSFFAVEFLGGVVEVRGYREVSVMSGRDYSAELWDDLGLQERRFAGTMARGGYANLFGTTVPLIESTRATSFAEHALALRVAPLLVCYTITAFYQNDADTTVRAIVENMTVEQADLE